ncbi:HIT domain-containing protein [bacterium]|nr:HIT domain-containing protein [bacterium]
MRHLWAPWRMRYILDSIEARKSEVRGESGKVSASSGEACFVCDALAQDQGRDPENQVVWRGPSTVVMLNRYPYNNGHLLVIPKAHRGSLLDFEGVELSEPVETIKVCMRVLDRMMEPQGYNVGLNQGRVAGAGLPGHLHWHIVPRWLGDVNFMPTLADTRVIVECLDTFYERFRVEFEQELASNS